MKIYLGNNIFQKKKQKGAAILVIIIAMIVVATLGIGIYALTSTAMFNQLLAQQATKAFYLSESGIRIAFSQYNTSASKNSALIGLHNKAFTMPDNIGKIILEIHPYWFYSNASVAAGTTSLTLYVPGALPTEDDSDAPLTLPSKGFLKLRAERGDENPWPASTDTYASYSAVSVGSFDPVNGTAVTFTLDVPFAAELISGDEFLLGNDGYSIAQMPSDADPTLILNFGSDPWDLNAVKYFPPQKGILFLDKIEIPFFTYNLRIIDTVNRKVKFTNIQPLDANQSPKWPYLNDDTTSALNATDHVHVYKIIGCSSTGKFGD